MRATDKPFNIDKKPGPRPLGHQAPRGLVPGGLHAPGFDNT